MGRCASRGVGIRDFNGVLINMVAVDVVEMTVMEVIRVISML
jgi:hypothetical protein